MPSLDLVNMDVVEADSLRAKGMGFAGKAAIHPNQLKPVNAVFRTSPEDLATARESLAAFEAAGDRKSAVEGKSVSVRVDLGGRRISKKKKRKDRHSRNQ